jgi:hypothetical protein
MAAPAPPKLPPGTKAKLKVIAGKRPGKTFGVLEEKATYIGNALAGAKMPVDIALDEQESPCKADNRHCIVYFVGGVLSIADTKTAQGTFLTRGKNRAKVPPGKKFSLMANDVIQIGTVQLQLQVITKKKTGVQK